MIDILDICHAQLGQHVAADGSTKYGRWLDAQPPVTHEYADADWCAASVLYCIDQVPGGLEAIGGLHKSDAYVQDMHNRLKTMGRVSMTPGPRKIVFYNWYGTGPDDNHVGIVKGRRGNTLYVYEGNHGSPASYELVERPFDGQVTGFAEWWSHVRAPAPHVTAAAGNAWFRGAF